METHFFSSAQPYEAVYQWQKQLLEARITDSIPDTLLLGEHPHVVTLGRGTHDENLLDLKKLYAENIPLVEIERGGDVTYHGPGQLIGYPIFKLQPGQRDLHGFLRHLELMLIEVLATYGLKGRQNPGLTGVWVNDQKIASIGIAVRKWVTYHGFALNVSSQLNYFQMLNPCGLPGTVMTSMATLSVNPDVKLLQSQIITAMQALATSPLDYSLG